MLDCVFLLEKNQWKQDNTLLVFLRDKAEKMLSYLFTITYKNGNVPMVNDSAYGIAPSSKELFDFANSLGLEYNSIILSESGYRKFKNELYELFVDIGEVGPQYQAGHAHADMLNFELHSNSKPFIVDTGTSTYENNQLRQRERGTDSHNTVIVNSLNQSQVWGSFRVARRAKIIKSETQNNKISATHDGYKKIAGLHKREFQFEKRKIVIKDIFPKKDSNVQSTANFHFHSDVNINSIDENSVEFTNGIKMIFYSSNAIQLITNKYQLANGFNNTKEACKVKVFFKNNLKTEIKL